MPIRGRSTCWCKDHGSLDLTSVNLSAGIAIALDLGETDIGGSLFLNPRTESSKPGPRIRGRIGL